jgi:hypothetical protein
LPPAAVIALAALAALALLLIAGHWFSLGAFAS